MVHLDRVGGATKVKGWFVVDAAVHASTCAAACAGQMAVVRLISPGALCTYALHRLTSSVVGEASEDSMVLPQRAGCRCSWLVVFSCALRGCCIGIIIWECMPCSCSCCGGGLLLWRRPAVPCRHPFHIGSSSADYQPGLLIPA